MRKRISKSRKGIREGDGVNMIKTHYIHEGKSL